jgi:hypothetical protein
MGGRIVLAFLCPAIIIVNLSGQPWNDLDQKNLDVAKYRCAQIFPNSPCVKKFIKKEGRTYNVVCTSHTRD